MTSSPNGDRRRAGATSARGALWRGAARWLVALALIFVAAPARADEAQNVAAAQSLFEAGRALMEEERWEEASKRFEESQRLDPSAGTLLNWGRCLELSGKTASAWAMYKRTIAFGKTKNQPRQVAAAEQWLADIEPKLAHVVLAIPSPAPDMVVRAGELALDPSVLGVPVAIDPGKLVVVASAPGFAPFHTEIEVAPGASVALEIPPLAALPPPPKKERPRPPPAPTRPGPLFWGAVATGGLGLAGLGVATGLGVWTLDDASDAENDPTLCPNKRCTPAGLERIEDARAKATASTALFAAGGGLVAVSGTLFGLSYLLVRPGATTLTAVLGGGSRSPRPTPTIAPLVLPGGAGLVVGGRL